MGLTRSSPDLAPVVVSNRTGVPAKGPPTMPALARNSSMMAVLKSCTSGIRRSTSVVPTPSRYVGTRVRVVSRIRDAPFPVGTDRMNRPDPDLVGPVPGIPPVSSRQSDHHGLRQRRLLLPHLRKVRCPDPAPVVGVGLPRGGPPLRLAPGGRIRPARCPADGPVRGVRRRRRARPTFGPFWLVSGSAHTPHR